MDDANTQTRSDPRDAAVAIVVALRGAGHTAYLAGGCVRDELLGLHPKDFDVATSAHPDEIQKLFTQTQSVGAAFGVVLVKESGIWTEVATFRSDGPYSDKRRPDHVDFATPPRDAARRDFTINALFLDPLPEPAPANGRVEATSSPDDPPTTKRVTHGEVIDYVGGLEDLKAGIIRAVGNADSRLREDDLRALRAVRFASRFGFTIDEETAAAIRAHAADLKGVSRERIGDEVRRMLTHPNRAVASWTIQYLGLDAAVLDEGPSTRAPTRLGRLSDQSDYPTCLAAWAIDRERVTEATQISGLVSRWRRALNLSNDERDKLKAVLVAWVQLERGWPDLTVAPRKRLAASEPFTAALRLVAAHDPEAGAIIQLDVDRLASTPSGLAPQPLLDGDALISLGFKPSPVFKTVLDRVYDAQLEDEIVSRDEAEALARELIASEGV